MDAIVFGGRSGLRLALLPVTSPSAGDARFPDTERHPAWHAQLTGLGLDVNLVCPEAGWHQPLADFLEGLVQYGVGEDAENWVSAEVELELTVARTATNTVRIDVMLTDGAPPRWRCAAEIEIDPGALMQIAADARRLSAVSLSL